MLVSPESSSPTATLAYVPFSPPSPKNRTARSAFILGLIAIPFAAALNLPPFGMLLLPVVMLSPLWLACGLAALGMGILGLRNARKPGTPGRDQARIAILLGGLTFLSVLVFLRVAIHNSDSMLNNPNAFQPR
jgi:hypothetical protein